MSNLLAASGERVYFKDLTSRFLFVSDGWIDAATPGRTPEDLIGKTDFDVFTEAHASAAFADEQEIMRTGESLVGQVERETFSGRPDAWVSTTKMPLRDEHGGIIGTFGISRDITAQIRVERELALQAGELGAQNEQLRELDRLKDEFVALVSHELRTPLSVISAETGIALSAPAICGVTWNFPGSFTSTSPCPAPSMTTSETSPSPRAASLCAIEASGVSSRRKMRKPFCTRFAA